ncbi:hypothetical protein GWI34_17030 [Actinomadura sp. DSM 109109]|nr:hypothetical protein [Actinomadura lepetitiana]
MTMRRMLAMAVGAVAPMALLALLFGNQWVVDELIENLSGDGIGPVLAWFLTLAWRITGHGSSGLKWVFAEDFKLLVFFGVLAGLVLAGARLADPERGPFGAVIIGWWAAVVAGGVSGVVAAPLTRWALEYPDGSFGRTLDATVGQGAAFGFSFGWIAGLGVLGGFFFDRARLSRPRPQQPYAPAQPYMAPQGGAPMGQPYPQQMPPHPSAVPYVPPQGQPQQPMWGAAPVPPPGRPQQPGQFGVPPVPPQPSAPPQEQTAPEAPEAPEPKAETPEEPGEQEEQEEAPEGAENAPRDTPQDAPGDDDLDLADRTTIDRRQDDDP